MLRRLVLACLLLALAPAVARAAPTVGPSFPLPGQPGYLHGNPDGSVWVAIQMGSDVDAVLVQPDGTQVAYSLANVAGAKGITVAPDGKVWVTSAGKIAGFDPRVPPPAAPATTPVTEVVIGGFTPNGIVAGPDGGLWTASQGTVYRVAPNGTSTSFPVAGASFRGIAAGADALFVADFSGPAQRVSTAGVATPITGLAEAQEIAADAAGNLALTQPTAPPHKVTLRSAAGTLTPVPLPASDPFGVVAAPDGAFWVARFAGSSLARIAPDGTTTFLELGTTGGRYLTTAGGGRLWVGLEPTGRVQRVDDVSAPVVAPVPTASPSPSPSPTPTPTPTVTPAPLKLTATTTRRRKPGRPVVRVTLSAAGRVAVVLERRAAGRRAGRRCVAPSKARRGRHCSRWVRVAARSATVAAATPKRVRLPRVGPGRYRVRVTGRAGSNTRKATLAVRVRR